MKWSSLSCDTAYCVFIDVDVDADVDVDLVDVDARIFGQRFRFHAVRPSFLGTVIFLSFVEPLVDVDAEHLVLNL